LIVYGAPETFATVPFPPRRNPVCAAIRIDENVAVVPLLMGKLFFSALRARERVA